MFPRLFIAGFLAVALAGLAGCKRVPPAGGSGGSKAEQARRQAETLVANGSVSAAVQVKATTPAKSSGGPFLALVSAPIRINTASKAPPGRQTAPPTAPAAPTAGGIVLKTPRPAPRPGSPAVIREHVVSSLPYPTADDADDDALALAGEAVERRLAELDPPVIYRPTPSEVKNEFVRRDTRTIRPADAIERAKYAEHGLGPTVVYVEYEVEVTADQIRDLRTRERVGDSLRVFGGLTAIALAGCLFLRLDEWTKGYLTRWLAAGAVTLALGAAAVLYLV